jgi:antitoxin component of MazEF toxin-antitoxin module
MFETKVRKVGNSASVIIPAPILKALDIPNGSVLAVSLDADGIVLRRKGSRHSVWERDRIDPAIVKILSRVAEFIEMLDRLGAENAGILRGLAK